MRVVKSSWDNDFTSWPKHHQLFFGGQSVELPLSLHWFSWLPPGGYQGLSMWEIWSKPFTIFWYLKDFDSHWCQRLQEKGHLHKSDHETPGSSDAMHNPRCYPTNTVRDSQSKVEKHQILVYGWGGTAPCDPINPYLGANAQKKNEPLFTCLFIYTHFGCLSLELNRVPGVLLEPYMSQGGQGSAELPIVLKGLRLHV